jgi:hypothetical protein
MDTKSTNNYTGNKFSEIFFKKSPSWRGPKIPPLPKIAISPKIAELEGKINTSPKQNRATLPKIAKLEGTKIPHRRAQIITRETTLPKLHAKQNLQKLLS